MIRNFEIGVLFVPSLTSDIGSNGSLPYVIGSIPEVNAEQITFPLPFTCPPPAYNSEDKVWFWGDK